MWRRRRSSAKRQADGRVDTVRARGTERHFEGADADAQVKHHVARLCRTRTFVWDVEAMFSSTVLPVKVALEKGVGVALAAWDCDQDFGVGRRAHWSRVN
jgi:hypothetical protein